MTINVRQEAFGVASSGNGTSSTATLTLATLASSTLLVAVTNVGVAAQNPVVTVTDNINSGAYTFLTGTADSTGGGAIFSYFLKENTKAGSLTATATFASTTSFRGVWIAEILDCAPSPFITGSARTVAGPGSTTDALRVPTYPLSTMQPALLVAIGQNFADNLFPFPGTGFPSGSNGWVFLVDNSTASEYKRVATGSLNASFTPQGTLGGDSYGIFAIALAESPMVPERLLQTTFAELTVDTTTTSGTPIDLLSQSIVTQDSVVLIHFSASANNNGAANRTISFLMLVDGITVEGSAIRTNQNGFGNSTSMVFKTRLTAGPHTIKIQWFTNASTAQIRPASTSDEHACLIIEEVVS